ncbi:rho GTPase-activating protein 29 [Antechinus flavipes]|uniref:rho GTPase-activating protein 29 n=1 Tax=Antechinus flavipes TaxID=38775 RepID=UPI00223577B0|nr:rho GTPase-activating protein 29 [Antechinus flavipes]
MLRQNGGSNKRGLSFARFSLCNLFPLPNSGNWRMGHCTKSNSLSSITSNPNCCNSPIIDPEYVKQLVNDVRRFAELLLCLKETILSEDHQSCLHDVVHERLGELLRILQAIIKKHQILNSADILNAAGVMIAKVKAVDFNNINEENKRHLFSEIFSSIESLAFTFGNVVSDFLMGDVDCGSSSEIHVSQKSQSSENISVESLGLLHEKDNLQGPLWPKELESILLRNDDGVELALSYAKMWSKYAKDIVTWVEKKISLEMECARNIAKMAETTKAIIGHQEFMPFQGLFLNAFANDIENSQLIQQTAAALQANKFVQPLIGRKGELDKQRKEMKELWQREQKKMQETEASLKKAKFLCIQQQNEYAKAKSSTGRAEEEHLSSSGGLGKEASKQVEKRRRLEEEALQKVEEANEHYRIVMIDMEERRNDLDRTKNEILIQLHNLLLQCDLTLKDVIINLFQIQHEHLLSLPINCQSLWENAKSYDPGRNFAEFVRAKTSPKEDVHHKSFSFDNLKIDGGMPPCRSWSVINQGGGMYSDTESAGGSSESRSMDSPSGSPGAFKRRLPRTPSMGTMSSADELNEREPPSPSEIALSEHLAEISSPGPFRNVIKSKAALSHKFRKLRTPSKCKECDNLVIFQGAECVECSLVCHKTCLETLTIQCGHQRLHGKLHLFGGEFALAAKNAPDGIPFIIKKCTSEIEKRALHVKGIYRMNGVKLRVEKLCQSFENGKDLVELSGLCEHDISNVLKLYLRKLPEPLFLFHLYDELIDLAKESQNVNEDSKQANSEAVDAELNKVLKKIKALLKKLPAANYNTIKYLIGHLNRVVQKSEENKMPASNLGIIFGPTLIRPQQTDAKVSLSSLVDCTHQARFVELLIANYEKIFDVCLLPLSASTSESPTFKLQKLESCLASKEGIPLSHNESVISETATSFGGLHDNKNALEEADACAVCHIRNGPVWLGQSGNKIKKSEHLCGTSCVPGALPHASQLLSHLILMMTLSENAMSSVFDESEIHPLKNKDHYEADNHSDIKCNQITLRSPKIKTSVRPVSLPGDQFLLPNFLSENSSKNIRTVNSDKFDKTSTTEEMSETKSFPNSSSRLCCYDPKTWDKQVRQYDNMTTRTAVIMPNTLQENRELDSGTNCVLSLISDNSRSSAMHLSQPDMVPVTVPRIIEEGCSSNSHPLPTFRARRTLQPPPGTFYMPHPNNKIKGNEESFPETYTATPISVNQKNTVNFVVTSTSPRRQVNQPKISPEELRPSDVKPVCQRLRPKRIQDLEQREAQFV